MGQAFGHEFTLSLQGTLVSREYTVVMIDTEIL